jgi:hypothetical protein
MARRITPSYAAANLLAFLAYGVPFLVVFAWLPLGVVSPWLFSHAIFLADLALWVAWAGLLFPALAALALSGCGRRVTISNDGLLIGTWGFAHLLRAGSIAAVECGAAPLWMWGLRRFALGGDAKRWVLVRMKSGFTLRLAVRDPDQFLRDAAQYLGGAVAAQPEPEAPAPEAPPAAGPNEIGPLHTDDSGAHP